MLLAEKLEQIRTRATERIAPENLAVMHEATENLRSSGILDRVIQPGMTMPDFDLLNQRGVPVSSVALLARGPLVLTVFRGSW